jgi:hypothetical protein
MRYSQASRCGTPLLALLQTCLTHFIISIAVLENVPPDARLQKRATFSTLNIGLARIKPGLLAWQAAALTAQPSTTSHGYEFQAAQKTYSAINRNDCFPKCGLFFCAELKCKFPEYARCVRNSNKTCCFNCSCKIQNSQVSENILIQDRAADSTSYKTRYVIFSGKI